MGAADYQALCDAVVRSPPLWRPSGLLLMRLSRALLQDVLLLVDIPVLSTAQHNEVRARCVARARASACLSRQ